MTKHDNFTVPLHPRALGTGLLALDVVVNVESGRAPCCYAGGTCGNVLTVLRYLGWDSSPISRLSPGPAADVLLADLRDRKVSTDFVAVEDSGSTPVIVQRICRTATGEPYHTFSWRCPGCGSYLPGYKPVLASAAAELAARLPKTRVFFFDRVSRGALILAKASAELGALVVFEPSGIGDPKLFREAWSLAHVVKYSHERLRDIADVGLRQSDHAGVLLEIETRGAEGLRYRSRLPRAVADRWQTVHALKVPVFKDAAGAGDWCTAGVLHRLAQGALARFRTTTSERLQDALRYGQALAAWNCGFDGARGGMYHVDMPTFKRQVEAILNGAEAVPATVSAFAPSVVEFLKSLCPACECADFAKFRNAGFKGRALRR